MSELQNGIPTTGELDRRLTRTETEIGRRLDTQDAVLQRIIDKLDNKADDHIITGLATKVDHIEVRVQAVERHQSDNTAVLVSRRTYLRGLATVISIAATLVAGVIYSLASTIHHP